jgi:hypothetical protein
MPFLEIVMKRASVVLLIVAALALPATAETKIGPRGQVIVDGKPVIPMAVWSQPPYLFEYHSQLGMNCMVAAHTDRGAFRNQGRTIFPQAEKHGMGLVTQFRDEAVKERRVWGWLNRNLVPGNLDRLKRASARIRVKDPTRFVMSNIAIHGFLRGEATPYYTEGLKHVDAIISHVWPEVDSKKPNIRNVALMIDRVRTLCKDRPGGEVSIWPDINPHQWSNKKKRNVPIYPSPTREELRFQIWLALIHGADAICIFPVSFDPFVYSQIPAKNEQELAWNTQLVERMTPALVAEESPLEIRVAGDKPESLVDVTTRTTGGKHTVFLVNGERRGQKITLTVPGLGTKWLLRDAIKDKPLATAGGAYADTLGPLALRIWELVPAKTSDASGDSAKPEKVANVKPAVLKGQKAAATAE